MGQVLTKNEGFSDFCEGWVPFLLEIKQKTGWLVGMVQKFKLTKTQQKSNNGCTKAAIMTKL